MTNPERNKGARIERAAIRAIIRKRLEACGGSTCGAAPYQTILDDIAARVKLAAKRKGGAGRK